MSELRITMPEKIANTITQEYRYYTYYGGRGSGKSHSIARFLILTAYQKTTRILCCREVQNSIKDSVHTLLSDIINENEYFRGFFTITKNEITGVNGSNIIFRGLKKETAGSVKSLEGIDICWIEEAQYISKKSLDILIPTIRKANSKIIMTLNPTNDDDPVYSDYVIKDRIDNIKVLMNYNDNYFFPDTLRSEMEYDRENDLDKYLHVWEGQTIKHSDAQVFNGKWRVDCIDRPNNVTYYYGADFGYSPDPNTLIECYIHENKLYITREAYKVKCEIVDTPKLYDTIITKQSLVNADCSRPELISYMKNLSYNIVGKNKLKVEDGITFLRSFKEIIIDERCKNTIYEFRNYCYNVDKITGQITNKLIDKHNHCIDALRYAIYHLIKHCQLNKTSYSASNLGL